MKLTAQERKKLNEGLALLKRVTISHVNQFAADKKMTLDTDYVNKLIETYVNEEGVGAVLADTFLAQGNCVCGITCASPCKNSMTGVGT